MNESEFPEIFYTAIGGAPKVDDRLSINPDGSATLYIGSSDSLIGVEVDEVGFFSGPIAASERQTLLDLVEKYKLATELADRQSISPDPVTGHLTLRRGEQSDRMVFAQIDNMPGAVEVTMLLNEWMVALLDSPRRTVQTTLTAVPDGTQVNLQLTLTNRGTEPLPIILLSDNMLSQFLKMELAVFDAADDKRLAPLTKAKLDRETVSRFVDAGLFAAGWHELQSDVPLTLDLPPLNDLPPGDYQVQATFFFWLPGDGLEERLVTVRPTAIGITVPGG